MSENPIQLVASKNRKKVFTLDVTCPNFKMYLMHAEQKKHHVLSIYKKEASGQSFINL